MKVSLKLTISLVLLILSAPAILPAQDGVSTIGPQQAITLTVEEQAWLTMHPDIQLGYTDAFEPEVIVDPNGGLRGIQVDILEELNRRLGIRIGLRIYPVPELIEKAQQKEIDGVFFLHGLFPQECF